jgi:ABC-type antimicrobial peptide transport system permease subunit
MTVSWGTVATGIAIAVFMGAVSGLFPAVRAARLQIVEALRKVD